MQYVKNESVYLGGKKFITRMASIFQNMNKLAKKEHISGGAYDTLHPTHHYAI